ncbi:MAG: MerR family transcriptional regulator [Flavobacteriales bacterium]|jgi:DNA-binding transcriptional MerR regulator
MKMQEFSIKDLENYTGIKAHTIRIWEQRYGLLSPDRTGTNIRKYTDHDLKYLLNVSLLINYGFKISQIAGMPDEAIREAIREHALSDHQEHHVLHTLKIAMLNYDEVLFHSVIDHQVREAGLENTYRDVLMPFLRQIGILWQANVICPAQEHFISALIRQKIFALTEAQNASQATTTGRPLVMFLPDLEIHELSLIMLHYIMRQKGRRSIFLGQSVPLDDLTQVYQRLGEVDFVSIFTTNPSPVLLPDYLKKIIQRFESTECHFHLTGNNLAGVKSPDPSVITLYAGVEEMIPLI